MRTRIFAANWKMNKGPAEAAAFMRAFLTAYAPRDDRAVVIFPPALALSAVVQTLAERPDVAVGVQDVHWEDAGAFTGQNAAPAARDAGASYALVGHSERRHLFGETDEETARKVNAVLRARLKPMLCVGETLEEREAARTEEVVLRQLHAGLSGVSKDRLSEVVIAYEPVWAIGTGRNATPADASAVHQRIRLALDELGGSAADPVAVLYGGSVNRGNVRELLDAPGIDGVLVGGASLEPESWTALAQS